MLTLLNQSPTHLLVQVDINEANLNHSEAFKTQLVSLLNTERRSVWLDMQQVTYVDSSFLGALVASLKHAMGMGCDLVLLALQKDVNDLLKLIRLDKVFKIYPDEQAATAATI
jgi:anti-sigma B factor antagonist